MVRLKNDFIYNVMIHAAFWLLQCLAGPSELHIDFVIEDKYPLE